MEITNEEKAVIIELLTTWMAERSAPVRFELDTVLTVGLIGQLQLAFRHPANIGETRQMFEKFTRELIERHRSAAMSTSF